MIRRDAKSPAGAPEWILISQIDHAHLAGQLAESWGREPFAPLAARDELLWAIYHHDDGWADWEQAPSVDPQHARPRSFTEMELPDTVAIWRASIELAAAASNLPGYLVAGHFCALLRRFAGWPASDSRWPVANSFLTRYEFQMDRWLAAWQATSPSVNTLDIAHLALSQLQFFDLLSLWFCCTPTGRPAQFDAPSGSPLTISPRDNSTLGLSPWPLSVPRIELEIPGRAVPAARYADHAELAAAPSRKVALEVRLEPLGESPPFR